MLLKPMYYSNIFYNGNQKKLFNQINNFAKNINFPVNSSLQAVLVPRGKYEKIGQTAIFPYFAISKKAGKIGNTIILITQNPNIDKSIIGIFEEYETPLGNLQGDKNLAQKLIKKYPKIFSGNIIPLIKNQSLEIQFPFLKRALKGLSKQKKILPIIISQNINLQTQKQIGQILLQIPDVFFVFILNFEKLLSDTDLNIFFETAKISAKNSSEENILFYLKKRKNWQHKIFFQQNNNSYATIGLLKKN